MTHFDRHFRPERLPVPKIFYEGEGFRLARPNSKGLALAQGPISCHQSESGKSTTDFRPTQRLSDRTVTHLKQELARLARTASPRTVRFVRLMLRRYPELTK